MSTFRQEWRFVLRYPGTCTEEVEDDEGEPQPCGACAVAVRIDVRENAAPYPVCLEHTRPPMAGLDVILHAERDSAQFDVRLRPVTARFQAEQERDAAEAKLAAVEALCDEWAGLVNARLTPDYVSREVRAAMRGGS